MNWIRPFLSCIIIVFVFLVAVSLLDILLASVFMRFYSKAALIVSFGVGGVFAASFGYVTSIAQAPVKNEFARWSLIIFMIIIGLTFFFFLARIEGGEYEPAFKAYGATLAFGSLLFAKGSVEQYR